MTLKPSPRLLVVTADLGGNVPPALGIASRLVADGAAVHVLSHSAQDAAATSRGLPFTPYTRGRAYDPLKRRSPPAALASLISLFCDRGIGADLLELAARERSDVVLVDCMLLGGLRASSRAGHPTVALVHSLPTFFTGPWAHGPIGGVAALRGLRPTKVWRELNGAVTASLPALAGTDTALGGPVVGPVWAGAPRPAAKRSGRPRILVSLSTIEYPGQDSVAQRLLDALGGLDVDAVFTTGPALDPADLSAPRNVELHPWLDHAELMPDVDLVIGHGGHTTTMRALAHDLPLLMLPMHPMLDQPIVARVVAEHGAGLALPREASPEAIRQAVHRLLDEAEFTAAAAALGAQSRARDGAAVASEYLLALAATAVSDRR